jgi:hypothetical protein
MPSSVFSIAYFSAYVNLSSKTPKGNSVLLVIRVAICYNKLKVNKGGEEYGNERYYS